MVRKKIVKKMTDDLVVYIFGTGRTIKEGTERERERERERQREILLSVYLIEWW